MSSARFRSSEHRLDGRSSPARGGWSGCIAAMAVLTIGGPGSTGTSDRAARLPTRLHVGAGWGVPAVDEHAVYYLSKYHELVCVGRTVGGTRWKRTLGGGAPVTAGTTVALAGPLVVAGDDDLFALDRLTGAQRWRFSPAVGYGVGHYLGDTSGSAVLTGSPSGRVHAVDRLTGTLRWMSDQVSEKATVFPPVATDTGVVAGYTDYGAKPKSGGVMLLDADTGTARWRTAFPRGSGAMSSAFAGGPVVAADFVFAAASDGAVYALDRATGSIRWSLPAIAHDDTLPASSPGEDLRPMTLQSRILIVGSATGLLTAIDVDRRREAWRFTAPRDGSIAFRIESDDRAVYVPYLSGRLVAVSLATGRELWRTGGSGIRFFWPPAVYRGALYLTTEEGLYAAVR